MTDDSWTGYSTVLYKIRLSSSKVVDGHCLQLLLQKKKVMQKRSFLFNKCLLFSQFDFYAYSFGSKRFYGILWEIEKACLVKYFPNIQVSSYSTSINERFKSYS